MGIDHATQLGSALAALCAPGDAVAALSIAATLFAAGLFGGFAHCTVMCGPFVFMQLAGADGETDGLRRLAAGAMPGYHLGRMTTYVALGAAAGGAGGSVARLTEFRWVLAIPLAAAALCFLLQAMKRLAPSLSAGIVQRLSARWGAAIARIAAPLLHRRNGPHVGLSGYGLGVVLGLLPCGFLYAALIAAAASGSAGAGGIAMAGFALGTVPALVAVGVLGGAALQRWRALAWAVAAPVFLLNAMTLGVLAARTIG